MAEQRRVDDPGQELKERSLKEFTERTKGKPTPTQEENDRAALGEHVVDKEPDGGEPDPGGQPGGLPEQGGRHTSDHQRRTMSGGQSGQYETRQSTPRPAVNPTGSKPSQ